MLVSVSLVQYASILNCKVANLPFGYLGILIGGNPRHALDSWTWTTESEGVLDSWTWTAESEGSYTVQSAYKAIHGPSDGTTDPIFALSGDLVFHRIYMFSFGELDRLSSRVNLPKRKIITIVDHLLTTCPLTA